MDTKLKIGCKVVRRCGLTGRLTSYSWFTGRIIYYSTSKFARPDIRCGPLTLFNSLPNAGRFVRQGFKLGVLKSTVEIWTCMYVPETIKSSIWHDTESYAIELEHLPEGTVLAKRIKLSSRIHIPKRYYRL